MSATEHAYPGLLRLALDVCTIARAKLREDQDLLSNVWPLDTSVCPLHVS